MKEGLVITVKQPVHRRELDKNVIQKYADYKTNDDRQKKITDLAQSGLIEPSTDYRQWNNVQYVYGVREFNKPSKGCTT